MVDLTVKGFVIGGVVGALLAHFAGQGGDAEDDAATKPLVDFTKYPTVSSERALMTALHEPAGVFASVDRALCDDMLSGFERLASIFRDCHKGVTSPALLADALQAKRATSNALLALVRKTQRTKPSAASDMSEDVEALKRFLTDYLHNIDQEQGLQRASFA